MSDKQMAIEILKDARENGEYLYIAGETPVDEHVVMDSALEDAIDEALEALRRMDAEENPIPLTLEQLKERKKWPVYWYNKIKKVGDWRILSKWQDSKDYVMFRDGACEKKTYGITWIAYDHKPKEV